MRTRLIIILIVSFLFNGCLPLFLYNDAENTARKHMKQAIAHENNSQFNAAVKEYAIVTKKYPQTSYYKKAIYRSAFANIDSQTPNYDAALALIQTSLSLSLTHREKRAIERYETLLTHIIGQIKDSNDQKNELEEYKEQIKGLKEKLQRMKVIDVQMHENKRKQR